MGVAGAGTGFPFHRASALFVGVRFGPVAPIGRAPALHAGCCAFESRRVHLPVGARLVPVGFRIAVNPNGLGAVCKTA